MATFSEASDSGCVASPGNQPGRGLAAEINLGEVWRGEVWRTCNLGRGEISVVTRAQRSPSGEP